MSQGGLREEVVHNVPLDDTVEQMLADEAKVAVNRGDGALDEGPVLGVVVRDIDVGVVEVGDGDCEVSFGFS